MTKSKSNTLNEMKKANIAVVIPCYRVEAEIAHVISSLPNYLKHIILVDDASPDNSHKIIQNIAEKDRRITLIRHTKNQGVGGAMVTGFKKALELNADVIVKIDGDGQMDIQLLPDLIIPIIHSQADYTKGNRFRDFQALQKMPIVRRIGNMTLGFLTKAATGYWTIFDPTNGFIAINSIILRKLDLERIDKTFYFETDMLAKLYLLDAFVKDIPMPARYGTETSNLSIQRSILEFSVKLTKTFIRRILLKNLIYDFSMSSIYIFTGWPLLIFGLVFGITKWAQYSKLNIPAPTGTVMLPTLSVILGIQFLIAAIEIDLRSTPKEPISKPSGTEM